MVLLAKVLDPQHFGVAKFDSEGRPVGSIEMPKVFVPFGTIGTAWNIPLMDHQPVIRMLKDGYTDFNPRIT